MSIKYTISEKIIKGWVEKFVSNPIPYGISNILIVIAVISIKFQIHQIGLNGISNRKLIACNL
jgi:hypothetical protein